MAGIIFSVASGVNDSVFGKLQDPLKAFIERANEAWMNNEMNLAPKIFHPFKLDSNTGSIASLGSLGEMEAVGENGAYPLGNLEEGYRKVIRAEEWKYSFAISQTAMEDKLDFVITSNGQNLMDAYYRTRNNFMWGLLGAALQNKHFVRKGMEFGVNTWDGVKLFAQEHPSKFDAKMKQCNAFSDAFSATVLGKLATAMQNAKNDNGEIIGLVPDTIVIPNTEKAKSDVFGVLGAYKDPDTAAGNKFNYQFGNWNVMVVPWLESLATANSYPFFLMDSDYNEKHFGALDVVRIEPKIKSYIDESTDANIWKIRARFSGAFGDWRAFYAGGVSFGKAL